MFYDREGDWPFLFLLLLYTSATYSCGNSGCSAHKYPKMNTGSTHNAKDVGSLAHGLAQLGTFIFAFYALDSFLV